MEVKENPVPTPEEGGPEPQAETSEPAGDASVTEQEPPGDAPVAEQEPPGDAPVAEREADAEEPVTEQEPCGDAPEATPEQLFLGGPDEPERDAAEARLQAVIEAIIYLTDEPLTGAQIAAAVGEPVAKVRAILDKLVAEYEKPERGLTVREVADGYKMGTKPEHHESIRTFVKNLKPPLKLSLAALETLAVIAYKQPITAPEVMEIRGVQGAGVLKTLLERKLITTAGRKQVVGRPILYKTTKDFLVQFGLKNLGELPTLKEFEELSRLALADTEIPASQFESASSEPQARQDEGLEGVGEGSLAAEREEASAVEVEEPLATAEGETEAVREASGAPEESAGDAPE